MRVDYIDDDEFAELERCLHSAEKRLSSRPVHQKAAACQAFSHIPAAYKRSATDSPATLQQQAQQDVRKAGLPRNLFARNIQQDQISKSSGVASCSVIAQHVAPLGTPLEAGSRQQKEASKQPTVLHPQHRASSDHQVQWQPNMQHVVQECNPRPALHTQAALTQVNTLQQLQCKQPCYRKLLHMQDKHQPQETQQTERTQQGQQRNAQAILLQGQCQPLHTAQASSPPQQQQQQHSGIHQQHGLYQQQQQIQLQTQQQIQPQVRIQQHGLLRSSAMPVRQPFSSSTTSNSCAGTAGQVTVSKSTPSNGAGRHTFAVCSAACGSNSDDSRLLTSCTPPPAHASAQVAAAPQQSSSLQLVTAGSSGSSCATTGSTSSAAGDMQSNVNAGAALSCNSHAMNTSVHPQPSYTLNHARDAGNSNMSSSSAVGPTSRQLTQQNGQKPPIQLMPPASSHCASYNGHNSRENGTVAVASSSSGTTTCMNPGQHAAASADKGTVDHASSTAGRTQQQQGQQLPAASCTAVSMAGASATSAAGSAAGSGSLGRRRLPLSMQGAELQSGQRQQPQQQQLGCCQQRQWQQVAPNGKQVAPHGKQQHQLQFHGTVRYSCNPLEVDWLCKQVLDAGPPTVIGLDIEWRPTFKPGQAPNRTALLQIAYAVDKEGKDWRPKLHGRGVTVLLLHVYYTGITPALQEILQREDITKVGVNIGGDVSKLLADFQVEVCGADDLSEAAHGRQLRCIEGITANIECKRWSLAGLVMELLGLELPKPQQVRLGNWERMPLTDEQKQYAALDAYASLLLHWELRELPERMTLSQQLRAAMKERAQAAIAASEVA